MVDDIFGKGKDMYLPDAFHLCDHRRVHYHRRDPAVRLPKVNRVKGGQDDGTDWIGEMLRCCVHHLVYKRINTEKVDVQADAYIIRSDCAEIWSCRDVIPRNFGRPVSQCDRFPQQHA